MLDPKVQSEIRRLLALKAQAVQRRDLRSVKRRDLALKKFLLSNGLMPSRSEDKQYLKAPVASVGANAALAKHKVPVWFRTGYKVGIRAMLWKSLSKAFQQALKSAHKRGQLPYYLPAPSFVAKQVEVAAFYKPLEISHEEVSIVTDGESTVEDVRAMEEAIIETMELEKEVISEALDETALAETLEQPGEGKLASEEMWYDDKSKVFLTAAAALLALSLVKG